MSPEQTGETAVEPRPAVMDNRPAVGAPKGWRWGYLTCGCRNDGYGYHLDDPRSPGHPRSIVRRQSGRNAAQEIS